MNAFLPITYNNNVHLFNNLYVQKLSACCCHWYDWHSVPLVLVWWSCDSTVWGLTLTVPIEFFQLYFQSFILLLFFYSPVLSYLFTFYSHFSLVPRLLSSPFPSLIIPVFLALTHLSFHTWFATFSFLIITRFLSLDHFSLLYLGHCFTVFHSIHPHNITRP
jgi:hypothetical protein